MSFTELNVNPRWVMSVGQGTVGVRKWLLDPCEDQIAFFKRVCKSHWPGNRNMVPINVQAGDFDDQMELKKGSGPTDGGMGALPLCSQTLVVAQYQFLQIETCWPAMFPKPMHIKGTVMSMDVKGSGQFILVSPNAFRAGGGTVAFKPSDSCRFVIPITEYHVSCDRLTRAQVHQIMSPAANEWDLREGTVNSDEFMGIPPEGLNFDSWNAQPSLVPDPVDPVRWRLTAVLRKRQIWGALRAGQPLNGPDGPGPYGWNHDYTNVDGKWGWYRTRVLGGLNGTTKVDRYTKVRFEDLFCGNATSATNDDCGG